MVALESRSNRNSPFSATVRQVINDQTAAPGLPAVAETASPQGGVVRLPDNHFQRDDRFVLSVKAAQHNLLDVVAEIVKVEPSAEGGCRAGVEFHPQLPRRHYVLVRRLADKPAK